MTLDDPLIRSPDHWLGLEVESWQSPVLLIGASDSGKSTFARYCCRRLLNRHDNVAFIDLDVGQNTFGLPTTAALGVTRGGDLGVFPPAGLRRRVFVGSISPVGYEARLLVALDQLSGAALEDGAKATVIDTSGFVDVAYGAADLKWAEVDLLRPCTVIALQREDELVPIVEPLAHLPGVSLIVLPVSEHVTSRSREARRAYRTACYRRYFADAGRIPYAFGNLAIFARSPWHEHQLAALEDERGFVLALATIEDISEAVVWLRTPLQEGGAVAALRLGDIWLAPDTFEDHYLG